MPLTRIEIPVGKSNSYKRDVADAVQAALYEALGVPMAERFQIVTVHDSGCLFVDPDYLGVERSADAIIVQIFLNEGRDTERKRGFYRTLADNLHARVGLRREDVMINLVEVMRNDWSFGNGESQLIA